MAGQLLDAYGRPLPARRGRTLRAKWDAAQTTRLNERHWAGADQLGPNAAASPEVRKKIRERARFEAYQNASYLNGIVQTRANDTIGTGPRNQLLTQNPNFNALVERRFREWADKVNLAEKLRAMERAKLIDGEAFALLINNPRLATPALPLELDLRLLEADHVQSPLRRVTDPGVEDGIEYDSLGNPLAYHVLPRHPGGDASGLFAAFQEPERIPARNVIHWYRPDRPGQRRGVSELAPAVPLMAVFRRFTMATVHAAETAADFAAVLKTNAVPPDVEDSSFEAMDAIPIEMRAMLTLPHGYEMQQFKADHPATTFDMFRRALINEIARCLSMPLNRALGDSGGASFSSAKMDDRIYQRAIEIERQDCVLTVLEVIFMAWFREAVSIRGFLVGDGFQLPERLPHRWYWDSFGAIDPLKEAQALVRLWEAGLRSDHEISFELGRDPEEHYRNLERQIERRREIGLPIPGQQGQPPVDDEESSDEGDADDDDRSTRGGQTDAHPNGHDLPIWLQRS